MEAPEGPENDAVFAAVEILIWQLVTSGVLSAESLAAELDRYARFARGGHRLRVLAQVARAAV